MSHNHVYVFKKRAPSKYSFVAEIRSCVEEGYRPISTMYIKMLAKGTKVSFQKFFLLISADYGTVYTGNFALYSERCSYCDCIQVT